MHKITLIKPGSELYPVKLSHITPAPKQLYYQGDITPLKNKPLLAVVGSRKVSNYGRAVTTKLVRQAAEQGIGIISGLALGVDGLAHEACLDAHGYTVAVMPCGLREIYPRAHFQLAQRILDNGGALLSEYSNDVAPYKTNFIERNRIVSGLSDAVLITEAATKSGTLHTANFALEQGKTVMAVPGNITSEQSTGTNNLIKTGASPITDINDILAAMQLESHTKQPSLPLGDTEAQTIILALIFRGIGDGAQLLSESKLSVTEFNHTMTMLEINGKIRAAGNDLWSLA